MIIARPLPVTLVRYNRPVAPEKLLDLFRLARDCGILTGYWDITGRRVRATPDRLLPALRAFGIPIERPEEAGRFLRERQLRRWQRPLEPVYVAWDGQPPPIILRVPVGSETGWVRLALELEGGEVRRHDVDLGTCPELGRSPDVARVAKAVGLPGTLPLGYHRLRVEAGPGAEALIISAPLRAARFSGRGWGVFLPLYALQTDRCWGVGDFTDLRALTDWVKGLGGRVVGILPVLAAFLEEPFEPSPYSPVSRLFWNELYVDPTAAPNFAECRAARDLTSAPEFRAALEGLRAEPLVDYQRAYSLKGRVLRLLADDFFGRYPDHPDFRAFLKERPDVEDYAGFRAAGERLRTGWGGWPEPLRSGRVRPGDFAGEALRYHLYVQWLADRQLAAASDRLYLDLPLGVHPDGYDVWRHRELFALGTRAGAPPDMFFTGGQDWGFPPLHPERLQAAGYAYFIAALRHHMRRAAMLRLDHVMAFHRLYWLPPGLDARSGVYVRYPADELYAIVALESTRSGCGVVGENLGTVPPEVNPALERHGLLGMYVLQFELRADGWPRPPSAHDVAGLNTHDTPTFAGFWFGRDIDDRRELGLLDEIQAAAEAAARERLRAGVLAFLREAGLLGPAEADVGAVLRALLRFLARSEAALVLVNLEDLWLEEQPQNVPGTSQERPNWRRKARYSLEEFSKMDVVRETLEALNLLR